MDLACVDQTLLEDLAINASMDSLTSLTVMLAGSFWFNLNLYLKFYRVFLNFLDVISEAQLSKCVIKMTRVASVNLMWSHVENVALVWKELSISKKAIQKDVQNASALERPPDARALI